MKLNLFLSINDLYGVLLCSFFVFLIFYKAKKHYPDKSTLSEFKIGFYFRVIGIIASAIFNLYYVRADSSNFFAGAQSVAAVFRNLSLSESTKLFYTDFQNLPWNIKCFFSNSIVLNQIYDGHKTLIQIAGLISYFSLDSYIAISFFMSMWAYLGIWLIYRTMIFKYPSARKGLFYLVIVYPPLCFWTTGLAKDPLCIGSIGVLFYIFFHPNGASRRPVYFTLLGILSVFLLMQEKTYLLLSFGLSFFLCHTLPLIGRMRFAKKIMTLFLISGFFLVIIKLFSFNIQSELFDIFNNEIKGRVDLVTEVQLRRGGSSYNLGELDMSAWGLIKYVSSAINVALFRPYLWEYSSPLVIASSLEGMIMLFFAFLLLVKVGIKGIFKTVKSSPILLFSFFFTIFIAAMAGGIAFNFGTLARYKMPLIPFYYFFIISILTTNKNSQRHKESKT